MIANFTVCMILFFLGEFGHKFAMGAKICTRYENLHQVQKFAPSKKYVKHSQNIGMLGVQTEVFVQLEVPSSAFFNFDIEVWRKISKTFQIENLMGNIKEMNIQKSSIH